MENLWAPWRGEFIHAEKRSDCIFCTFPAEDRDPENLILGRTERSFAILNKFPYNNGHLMVIPRRHTDDFAALDADELLDLHVLLQVALGILREVYKPQGFNVGMNVGAVAGADNAGGAAAIAGTDVSGVSINDLRKNLRDLNEYMDEECRCASARYGIVLDASLITGIDPPPEVESALAAINTAHNQVSSDISLAQASADQRVVLSKRAVEIETLKAQAEVEPIKSLAAELLALKAAGGNALSAYLRNVRLALLDKAQQIYEEAQ